MKAIPLAILISVAVGLLLAQAPAWPPQPKRRRFPPDIVVHSTRDVVKLAPRQYTIEVENEQVRVLRAKLGPDDTVPTHDAPSGVFVALTEAHVGLLPPDHRMHSIDLESGQAQWIVEDTYSVKNLSHKPVEFLFIEMRPKSAQPARP